MALDLRISGPGLEVHRRLEPGDPALILGRDTDCGVCLPDPERNVSRRHLSVWNEGDQLHFHVLSVVNGVETAAGELPPGARGVLPPGEMVTLWAYRIDVAPVDVAPALSGDDTALEPPDPWAEFARQAEQLVPDTGPETVPVGDEDPFGEWGFQSTFAPGSPGGALRAGALQPAADLKPFFAGLGIDLSAHGVFTQGELETIGRVTRIAMHGLLQAMQAASASRQEARIEDRTTAEPREMNPLRMDTSAETKLYYLFGGHAAAAGFMPPDRAVAQMVGELTAHEQAMGEALRETVQKIVEEFDPDALKKRLLGGGARLFESARAWDAFVKDYAQRTGAQPAWVEQVLDRQFARAYAKALVRAKRNTTGRGAGG